MTSRVLWALGLCFVTLTACTKLGTNDAADSGPGDGGPGDGGPGDGGPSNSCGADQLRCSGQCVTVGLTNCGECGRDCTALPQVGSGVSCVDGECVIPPSACVDGFAHCTDDVADGCETELSRAETCGACDRACSGATPLCASAIVGGTPSYECVASCPSTAPMQCGTSCVDTDSNALHCGGCEACPTPDDGEATCIDGECAVACASGTWASGPITCTECTAISNCESGLTCTNRSDQICGTCGPGYVGDGTNRCTACASGQWESSNNTCSDCTACDPGTYLSTPCTATTDHLCSDCTAILGCQSGLTCTGSDDSTCATCAVGYLRDDAGITCAPTLTALTLSAGTLSPALSTSETDYTVQVPLQTQTITLTPEAPDGATVTIDGTEVASGAEWESPLLNLGQDNTITLMVSEAGAPSRSYTISVTRGSQEAYVKASNAESYDNFGHAVALSADGNTLAVGAYFEDSSGTGEGNNFASNAGAVYVFTRSGAVWSQQAFVKASNPGADDTFGDAVALSADGNTLAVGATGEASSGTGINGGAQTNNTASLAGAVYVFTRTGSAWSQQAYVKASNTDAGDTFGETVALADDGNTLAVGAHGEDSNGTGINSNTQGNNGAADAGAAYVFTRTGSTWSQQAYVKASNSGANDWFGTAVALSPDGNSLAVGANGEDSNGTGVNSNTQANDSTIDSGAVYVFTRSGAVWSQQAYVKASNSGPEDYFGNAVALSSDTLAVGASVEDSSGTGVNSATQANDSASNAGAAYVFTRAGSVWSQQAYVKASNTETNDYFGFTVALSADGNALAVVATGEDGNGTGLSGDAQANNSASFAGAVYLFRRTGSAWSQQAYVKGSNTGANDGFGYALALSADGNRLAVGAYGESSNGTGVNSNTQADNSASQAGAVYVFR